MRIIVWAIIIILIVSLLAFFTWTYNYHERLTSIQKYSVLKIRSNARELADVTIVIGVLHEDLEKYNCSVYNLKQDDPEKFVYYQVSLYLGKLAVSDLRTFLDIAYSTKGEDLPYNISYSLTNIDNYILSLYSTLQLYAYSKTNESMNCSIFPDNETLTNIHDLLIQIAQSQNINDIEDISDQLATYTERLAEYSS